MLYMEYFTLQDCSGFLQISSHLFLYQSLYDFTNPIGRNLISVLVLTNPIGRKLISALALTSHLMCHTILLILLCLAVPFFIQLLGYKDVCLLFKDHKGYKERQSKLCIYTYLTFHSLCDSRRITEKLFTQQGKS